MRLLLALPGLMFFLIDRILQNAFAMAQVVQSVGYWAAYGKPIIPLIFSLFLLLSIYYLACYITKRLPPRQDTVICLQLGFSCFAGGALSNALSLSLRGFALDYIQLPSIGMATNVADLAMFAGLALCSLGLSPMLIASISWKAK